MRFSRFKTAEGKLGPEHTIEIEPAGRSVFGNLTRRCHAPLRLSKALRARLPDVPFQP
jgi:hypothetical protein